MLHFNSYLQIILLCFECKLLGGSRVVAKSEMMSNSPTTYRCNFEIPGTNSKAQLFTSIKSDDREVLVKDGNHTWSIGYFDNSKLVLWSQYE